MKKFAILVMLLFSISLVTSAPTGCESKCANEKNSELEVLWQIKLELGACRPNYIECFYSEESFRECKQEFLNCRNSFIIKIREKNIEINNNYSACIKSCASAEATTEATSPKQASPFCMALQKAESSIIRYFGVDKYESISEEHQCEPSSS